MSSADPAPPRLSHKLLSPSFCLPFCLVLHPRTKGGGSLLARSC